MGQKIHDVIDTPGPFYELGTHGGKEVDILPLLWSLMEELKNFPNLFNYKCFTNLLTNCPSVVMYLYNYKLQDYLCRTIVRTFH